MNKRELKKEVSKWLTRTYGERCPDYDNVCVICQKWKWFDNLFDDDLIQCKKCRGWGWIKK